MKENVTNYIAFTMICTVAFMLNACGNSEHWVDQNLSQQYRDVMVYSALPIDQPGSQTIYYAVIVSYAADDVAPDCIAKVEFDPGDGSGWIDVTETWREKWSRNLPHLETAGNPYTYLTPGHYSYKGRVLFQDGQIYTFDLAPSYATVPRGWEP
jgi:hypothetical protein